MKKSLYSNEVYQDCLNRLEQITSETSPQWGAMTSSQMLSHCAEILEVANGKELENTPLIARLFKGMIRRMVLSEKPYRRSMRTHPQYEQVSYRDSTLRRSAFLGALDRFMAVDKEGAGPPDHPLFGKMTMEERGWSMYKHLDHHFTRFGV